MPPDGGEGDGVMPSKGGPCEKLSFPDPEPADDVERNEPSSKKLPRRMLGYDALTGDAEGDGSGFVDVGAHAVDGGSRGPAERERGRTLTSAS